VNRPPVGLAVAAVALVAGTAITSGIGTTAQHHVGAERVEVLGATAVCPDVRQVGTVFRTRISVGVAPLPEGRQASGGTITTSRLDGSHEAKVPIEQPGQVAVGLGTSLQDGGVVVRATGALATGLEVEQVARVSDGPYRGLAGLRCGAPKRDAWFAGAGASVVDRSVLVLANVDDTAATVDVTVFGISGRADPRPGQGITVAPHSRLQIPLESLAPDLKYVVTHVRSRQGRVVAALRHNRVVTPTPLGFDFVPQVLPPSSDLVVPGIPQGPGFRGLIVGNPGDDDTTISVQVTTRDGQFVPTGLNELDVPAGRTVLVKLEGLTNGSPLTARVRSTGAPVVASAYLVDQQAGQIGYIRENAYGASSLPLTGPALLTDLVINRPTESTLLLSAPDDDATVVVTPIKVLGSAGLPPAARTVRIPGGRTVALRLSTFFPPGTSAQLAVEVRPQEGSGPVYATRYLRERGARGTLTTLLTLQGPAQLVDRPVAVHDDAAGYP
jgi:hypothetical protein